jgi:hypothetical protein
VTLFLAALLLGPSPRTAQGSWAELFADLARLEQMDPSTRSFEALAASLRTTAEARERDGLKKENAVEKYRARLILHHVERLRGSPPRAVTVPDVEPPWVPHEGWFAARALAPSWYRVQAGILALDETSAVSTERALVLARIADEERALLRLDLAESAAAAVLRRMPNEANALRLARVLALRGSADAARETLTRALASASADAERARLLCARANIAEGARDERAALADRGAALTLCSDEAALDLAARALERGEATRARVLAAAVLSASRTAQADPAGGDATRALVAPPEPATSEPALSETALSLFGRALLPPPRRTPAPLPGGAGKVP